MTTTTPKTRTITLTDRPPVKINEADWPILAEGSGNTFEGVEPGRRRQADENGDVEKWWLLVRQHADGRTIVYGIVEASCFQDSREDWRGGELLPAGSDLAAAIRRVGESGHLPDRIIRECIADLPAEEL
jgi:hypothetical protein